MHVISYRKIREFTQKYASSILNQVYSLLSPYGGIDQLIAECEAVNGYKGNNYFPLIWRFYKSHRSAFFRLINAFTLLRKLGNYSRKNRLYRAFRELGRVIRTIFLLEYIQDPKLRRQITAATNKVEAPSRICQMVLFWG